MNYHIGKGWIYLNIFNLFYINIINPFKTMNKLKNVFIPLKCYFWFGNSLEVPIMFFNLQGKILSIVFRDVSWKDKYDTPRYEECPFIAISIFRYCFVWYWKLYPHLIWELDNYWEQALWYLYYNDCNIIKSVKEWPWSVNNVSSWNNKFLTNEIKDEITDVFEKEDKTISM